MPLTSLEKGKAKALAQEIEDHPTSSDTSDSESDISDSSDDSSSESESEQITPEYLDSLLEKARQNARNAKASMSKNDGDGGEDVIQLDGDTNSSLPPLDPGKLPSRYIDLSSDSSRHEVYDPEVDQAQKASSSKATPDLPLPPPELTSKDGKALTKKERKALKKQTAGYDWYDLPAPPESELPRLHREVEALRLRNRLDPKRFYRKDEGEGKGIKGLPKYFAIGTILPTPTPFAPAPASDTLPRSARKRTLVDELVDDAEAKAYAKKKFKELQGVRGEKGRGTLAKKKAGRRTKW